MTNRKQPERRTFRQDRFEILIKRQKNGTATFNELTELDDLVNRDPELRERVILENILAEYNNDTGDTPEMQKQIINSPEPVRSTLLNRIKSFLNRLFLSKPTKLPGLRLRNLAFV